MNYFFIKNQITKTLLIGFTIIVGFLYFPQWVHAQIRISEVAYAGTLASQYEEWIELFNDSDDPVVIDGWIMTKSSTVTIISLTGTIAPRSWFLICRTTASLINPLEGACDQQGTFSGSGLSNTGDHLVLKNNEQVIIDEIPLIDGKWPVHSIIRGETMQLSNNGWFAGVPTPREQNNSLSEINGNNLGDTEDTESKTLKPSLVLRGEKVEYVEPDPVYSAQLILPEIVVSGVAFPIEVIIKEDKREIMRGKFEWSMGDGKQYRFDKKIPFNHTFFYPGDYVVTMTYYSSYLKEKPDSIHRKRISVISDNVSISNIHADGGIIIHNASSNPIDLENWSLSYQDKKYIFPKYTLVSHTADLSIPVVVLGFHAANQKDIILRNPSGKIVQSNNSSQVKTLSSHQEIQSIEDVGESPELSHSSYSSSELIPVLPVMTAPKLSWFEAFWDQYSIIITITIIGIGILVAYLLFRLYATEVSFLEEDSDDLS